MTQAPLLTTGLQGLVGSKLEADFGLNYDFESLDIHDPVTPVDITDLDAVMKAFEGSDAQAVVHLAAYTDVTAAWEQQGDKDGIAYKVNVVGTENIVKAAQSTGKHLIHISTSYVFDGEKAEPYVESDAMKPIEWYGTTKMLAEEAVQKSTAPWTILRIDHPFRSDTSERPDALRKLIDRVTANPESKLFTDHWFGPTFIDDFAKVIDWAIRTKATGLYHASSGEKWNDYDFAVLVNEKLGLDLKFEAGSLEEYLKTSQRPYQKNTSLNCEKLKSEMDFEILSVEEAVEMVRLN